MQSLLVICLSAGTCLSAQVQFSPEAISVKVDGKPFTVFHYGTDANKPYFAPLRSASGKIVTRQFPMEQVAGESQDHWHHRGLWVAFKDVNGINFWENDPSYTRGVIGFIKVRKSEWKDGEHSGMLRTSMDWVGPGGKILLREDRDQEVYSDPKLRTIDFVITLVAATDVTFGDIADGLFAIRLADDFAERKGGRMVNAEAQTGMLSLWGKHSKWVDYTAELGGERLGVAIFDNPHNPAYPTYWLARDYGLFTANPFGQNAFDDKLDERPWKLPAGPEASVPISCGSTPWRRNSGTCSGPIQ